MNIDFTKYYHELFEDWHANETKASFTQKMTTYAQNEKDHLPTLLSRTDLKQRWNMNSRQSVHQAVNKPDFPQPVYTFNQGKVTLYLETDIQIFEINHPWLITPGNRLAYSHWILRNVIDN
ncbi:hypothetical protein AB0X56_10245 [Weissella paramesenteroides]|uniref:hypothetical protein n=1 Tax=Weissella paramesenteroides TaxID=1249 RepID=UPI002402A905|nr:hypothetical protein [Weissella paramesenteroides]MDF8367979.1 hypothetical protein [Weissella paramesenteroides]